MRVAPATTCLWHGIAELVKRRSVSHDQLLLGNSSVPDYAAHMVVRLLPSISWLALAACSANDDVPAPAISAVQPDHAAPGTTVAVSGSYLCQDPRTDPDGEPLACEHMGTVMFDTTPGMVTSYTDTMVLVDVPALTPGRVSVVVSVVGRSSNSIDFVVE